MTSLLRRTTLVLGLTSLVALTPAGVAAAQPDLPKPVDQVLCYVKTHNFIVCFEAGP